MKEDKYYKERREQERRRSFAGYLQVRGVIALVGVALVSILLLVLALVSVFGKPEPAANRPAGYGVDAEGNTGIVSVVDGEATFIPIEPVVTATIGE